VSDTESLGKTNNNNNNNNNNNSNNNNSNNKSNRQNRGNKGQNDQSKYYTKSYTESDHDEYLVEPGHKRRIRAELQEATNGNNLEKLEKTIEKFEKNRLWDNDDLKNANTKLEFLKLKRDLRDSIRRNHVGVMEKAIEAARASKHKTRLQPQIDATEKKMLNQMELNKYAHDILAMEPSTISEIHSYHRPPACVHDVMAASYMLLGHDEAMLRDWAYIQGMAGRLGKESLITQVREFDTARVDDVTSRRVREIINYHDLDEIRAASNGAATFHCWADSITSKIHRDKEEAEDKIEEEEEKELYREEEVPPSMADQQRIARGRR